MAYSVYTSGDIIAKNIGDTSGRTAQAGGSYGGLKLSYEIRFCTETDDEYTKGHYYIWYKLYGWFSTNVSSSIYISYYSTGNGGYMRLTSAATGTIWNAELKDYTYRSTRSPRWNPNNPPNKWYAVSDAPSGYRIYPEGSIDLGEKWKGDTFTFSYYRARFLYNNNYSASYNNTQSATVTIEAPPEDTSRLRFRINGKWLIATPFVRYQSNWLKAKAHIYLKGWRS